MPKENANFNFNWYELWMQQSKNFFSSAESNLKQMFTDNKFINPEENFQQVNAWLEKLKESWQFAHLTDEQKAFQVYWKTIAKMYDEASDLMLKEWMKRSHSDNPIKSFKELYELWLNSCHEVYQQTLKTKAYQEAYGDFMNAAIKFWQLALHK